jgi:hypothetical protein
MRISRSGKVLCASLLGGIALWADEIVYIRNLNHTGIGNSVIFPRLVELSKNIGYSNAVEPVVWASLIVGFSPAIFNVAGKIAYYSYDKMKPYAAQIIPKANELISRLKSSQISTNYSQIYAAKI